MNNLIRLQILHADLVERKVFWDQAKDRLEQSLKDCEIYRGMMIKEAKYIKKKMKELGL